jgi:hypothetical protein
MVNWFPDLRLSKDSESQTLQASSYFPAFFKRPTVLLDSGKNIY